MYTSYKVAVAAVFQLNAAVELVAITAALAGETLETQEGGTGVTAVVKLVWLALQPATGPKPLPFFAYPFYAATLAGWAWTLTFGKNKFLSVPKYSK